jgi:hypothetical protein
LIEEVRRVSAMQDHALRVKAAVDLMTELQAAVIETSRMRKESIAWLRKNGHSMADVAKLMGVSRARVAQLRDAGPPPERAFLGTQSVQVAVPLRPGEREYVAVEDSSTGQKMLALAQRLQLDGELQYIPVSGELDLNREDLVVVCGPKTSAAAAAALSLDPRLSFETLPDGRWARGARERHGLHLAERRPERRDPGRRGLPGKASSAGRAGNVPPHRGCSRCRVTGRGPLPEREPRLSL